MREKADILSIDSTSDTEAYSQEAISNSTLRPKE